jgi:hypothetical protein
MSNNTPTSDRHLQILAAFDLARSTLHAATVTTDNFNTLLSCPDVSQYRQPSGSLTRKSLPPKDRVKLTGPLTHMKALNCLRLQLTVHRGKNVCVYNC